VLSLVETALQLPLRLTVVSQLPKAVFTAACVWQAAAEMLVGQVIVGVASTKVTTEVQEAEVLKPSSMTKDT
jgi:hypothetical protein